MNFDKSNELYEKSKEVMPGGVNSPARAFNSVGGVPPFFEKAKGSVLTDVDGNEFIDYVGSWGPMILGHAHEPVIKAVQETAANSTSFGSPTEIELKMANLVREMVPNVDKIRMANSGTEACMGAIRTARGYTGKDKIVKFEGNYHGHGDSFLIKAGSGALTLGQPSSPGVTKGTVKDTLTAQYNDLENVAEVLQSNKGEVAALIVEPVAGNMGCVPPEKEFLQGLRELCDEHGVVLIFDEVMSGFRLSKAGAQGYYDVYADLVTFGKIIGAGMPVGAFGGKEEIMNMVSPAGPVYHAGTLSGNPLAMAAGYTLLSELNEHPEYYDELEEKGQYLKEGLRKVLDSKGIDYTINQVGSMMTLFFTAGPVVDQASAQQTDTDLFGRFYHGMLEQGIYLPPSNFECFFLSRTLTNEMLDKTIAAADKALDDIL